MRAWTALIKMIIKEEGFNGKIDLNFVNDEAIKKLNKKFRKKDKPTDVLSFSYGGGPILGDIIISKETARRNAARLAAKYRDEIRRLVIHGTLHVLGYDHGRKMSHAEKIYSQF